MTLIDWGRYAPPPPVDPSQGQQTLSDQILLQGDLYNQNVGFQLEGRSGDWENQILQYQHDYNQQNLALDERKLGLASGTLEAENTLNQQMYGLGVSGIHRDQATEQALHDLRNQGFGLDEQSLGLQGKRINLNADAIAQAEREQRQAYESAQESEASRAAVQGATVSVQHRRNLATLAQQLAGQLEADRRQRQGLTLDTSQMGLDTSRLGLSRQGEDVTHGATQAGLADQLAGLGYQHAFDTTSYGYKQQGLGLQGQQIQNDIRYNNQSLLNDQTRNNFNTVRSQLPYVQNLWSASQGRVGDPRQVFPGYKLPQ